jgi:hypothetical protein
MVLFFVLAGAALKLESLAGIGAIGMAYLVLRTLSRLAGGWLGATWSGAPAIYRRWIGGFDHCHNHHFRADRAAADPASNTADRHARLTRADQVAPA